MNQSKLITGLGLFLVVILLFGCEDKNRNNNNNNNNTTVSHSDHIVLLPKHRSLYIVEHGIRTYYKTYRDTIHDYSFSRFEILLSDPDTLLFAKKQMILFQLKYLK